MKHRFWFVVLTVAAGAMTLAAASCGGKLVLDWDASLDATSDAAAEGPYQGECCNARTGPYVGSCDRDAPNQIDWDTWTVFCSFDEYARPTYCTFNGCPGGPASAVWGCAVENDPSSCPAMNDSSLICGIDCQPNCCNGRYPGSFYDGHCCGP